MKASDLDAFLETSAFVERDPGPVSPPKRRRSSAGAPESVERLVKRMLSAAADLPEGSPLGRELAESAGRLQTLLLRAASSKQNTTEDRQHSDD